MMTAPTDTPVQDISGIVASLRQAYINGVTRPIKWRREQLEHLRRLVEENEEEIVAALAKDLRRPRAEVVLAETLDVLSNVAYFLQNLDKLTRKEKLKTPLTQRPVSFEVWKEPLGVVTIVAPWNFPFMLLLCPLAGAIAAGNACVLKPSELGPASAATVARLVPLYLDTSAIRVVTGGVPQATELLAQKVDHILYTGGASVARIVMAAAAKNLTPVTLELGGQCPAFVHKSANMETTARRMLWAKHLNGGQVCVAPNHVLVDQEARDSFLTALKKEHARMYPGRAQENPDISRVINDRHFQRLTGMLEDHGGEVFMGGNAVAEERFIDFTVVLDPAMDSKVMKEEVFGPILPVITVKSMDEAIAMTNKGPAPLAAYVFARDSKITSKWLTEVESGGASVNDCLIHVTNLDESGLAGRGESGMGRARGKSAFDAFTHRKTVATQDPNFDPLIKYPPYKASSERFIKFLLLGRIPQWVKLAFWGSVGAAAIAAANVVSKHVTVNFSVSLH